MKKMTKREIYEALIKMTETGTLEMDATELHDFAVKEIESLDKRAAKAKENAAKKAAEGDALKSAVQAVLTEEYQTIADIAAQVDAEDATVARVTYRLGALVKDGVAEKADVQVEGTNGKSRTVKAYKLAIN